MLSCRAVDVVAEKGALLLKVPLGGAQPAAQSSPVPLPPDPGESSLWNKILALLWWFSGVFIGLSYGIGEPWATGERLTEIKEGS